MEVQEYINNNMKNNYSKSKITMISIIIIVKNELGIEATLKALRLVKRPEKSEVIVVDASAGTLDNIKIKFPEAKWVNFVQNPKKLISIPEQRNVGVKLARGEIVVFIDANCIPDRNWLINLVNPIKNDGEKIVFGLAKSSKNKTIHDQYFDNISNQKYVDELTTINLALRKDIFEQIGLFDEGFGYGEDIDFSWRCTDAGFRIRYEKRAIVSHDWGDTKRDVLRSFRYGEAKMQLYKKNKRRLSRLITKDYYVLIYSLFLLLSPITIFFPYYPLLLIIPFLKNMHEDPINVIKSHLLYASGFIYEFTNLLFA